MLASHDSFTAYRIKRFSWFFSLFKGLWKTQNTELTQQYADFDVRYSELTQQYTDFDVRYFDVRVR